MTSIFAYRNPQPAADEDGPLQRLRVAIQPNLAVAGWPSDAGAKALSGFQAVEDSTVVRRLREAGGWICGTTRMSEFGFGRHNSHAGEALVAHVADVEMSLDLMGETRLAAARAGVCGFKPSYGVVSRLGVTGLMPSMESYGLLARRIALLRSVMQVVAGPDERDFSMPDEPTPSFCGCDIDPARFTLGVIEEAGRDLSAASAAGFAASVKEFERSGFVVRSMSMPEYSLFTLVHQIVGAVEASSSAGRYDSVRYGQRSSGAKNWNEMYLQARGAAFGPLLKSLLFQGAYFQFDRMRAYEAACRIRARLVEQMCELGRQVDALLLPVNWLGNAESPASLSATYAQFSSTLFANVTGQPVLYLPAVASVAPTGVQLAGARGHDGLLLALGEYLMNQRQVEGDENGV